jgi:hypothetical protein
MDRKVLSQVSYRVPYAPLQSINIQFHGGEWGIESTAVLATQQQKLQY